MSSLSRSVVLIFFICWLITLNRITNIKPHNVGYMFQTQPWGELKLVKSHHFQEGLSLVEEKGY